MMLVFSRSPAQGGFADLEDCPLRGVAVPVGDDKLAGVTEPGGSAAIRKPI